MATASNYYIGQGEIMVRRLNDDGTPAEPFWELGDCDNFTTDIAISKQNHYESQSGVRRKVVTWNTQTDLTFSIAAQDFKLKNLALAFSGTLGAGIVGAPVIGELIPFALGGDGVVYTEFPNISAVTVTDGDGVTALVEGTDYELDSVGGITGFTGGIRILAGAPNFVGPNVIVDYTHTGTAGYVDALTTPFQNYAIRLNAVDMADPNTPLIIEIEKAQFNPSESTGWISTDIGALTMTGDILVPESGNAPIRITEGVAK